MTLANRSTIAALSTAPAPSGVAVIRVSGPESVAVVSALFRSRQSFAEQPRTAVFGTFIAPDSGEKIDSGLVLYMPGPRSFTGEDVCELQLHGSPIIVREILRQLFAQGAAPSPRE
jgi:tRNA modification GTPase